MKAQRNYALTDQHPAVLIRTPTNKRYFPVKMKAAVADFNFLSKESRALLVNSWTKMLASYEGGHIKMTHRWLHLSVYARDFSPVVRLYDINGDSKSEVTYLPKNWRTNSNYWPSTMHVLTAPVASVVKNYHAILQSRNKNMSAPVIHGVEVSDPADRAFIHAQLDLIYAILDDVDNITPGGLAPKVVNYIRKIKYLYNTLIRSSDHNRWPLIANNITHQPPKDRGTLKLEKKWKKRAKKLIKQLDSAAGAYND